jgi:hypothetical protein
VPRSPTGSHVFAHLPIHRRLQRVLDRERAAFDKQVAIERRQSGHARKRFHKLPRMTRINIRVRDFEFGRAQQVLFTSG